jgi:hypothetical protein
MRGIRSSGQFTTISRFAQGWQAFYTRYLFAVAEALRTAIGPDLRLMTRRRLDERLFVGSPRTWHALARCARACPFEPWPEAVGSGLRSYNDAQGSR